VNDTHVTNLTPGSAATLLAGGDLLDAVIDAGSYDESMARRIFKRVLLGTQYMHDAGITHRDMKLENLLLGAGGNMESVKICDLGLAKKATEKLMEAVCGTPQYVSPEVVNSKPGQSYGPEVDNWACGVILFILLSGRAVHLS
jgi:serine/threonine protein kinase